MEAPAGSNSVVERVMQAIGQPGCGDRTLALRSIAWFTRVERTAMIHAL
jgi:hypothetical protein